MTRSVQTPVHSYGPFCKRMNSLWPAVYMGMMVLMLMLPTLAGEESWFQTQENDDGTLSIVGYTGPTGGELVVPGEIQGKKVTVIARYSLRNNQFDTVRVSENIVRIETASLTPIQGLRDIYLPASLEHIMRRSFDFGANIHVSEDSQRYRSVDGILFSHDMTTIKRFPSVREGTYTIPESVTWIRGDTFRETLLTELQIPDGVSIIGRLAFKRMENLTQLQLPASLEHFGDKGRQFEKCSNLQSMVIPDGVTDVPNRIFLDCTNLQSVTLPKNLQQIGHSAFRNCSSLTEISIPNAVRVLPENIFRGCTNLSQVVLPENLERIEDHAFADCTSLTTIVIPASVAHIGMGAFAGCTNLRKIYFLGDAPEVPRGSPFDPLVAGVPPQLTINHREDASGWPGLLDLAEWQGYPTSTFDPRELE